MKYGLLGNGKTGSYVQELLRSESLLVFNRSNIPTLEKLRECDVLISFLPGESFINFIDLIIESGTPLVTGSTGFNWPVDIDQKLIDNKSKWIRGNNFSLGVNILKPILEILGQSQSLIKEAKFSIHESHHTKKLDAPSGTAITMNDWLGEKADITSAREGDIVGFHELTIDSEGEIIKLSHSAKDRSIFAKGAIWSANELLANLNIPYGLNEFNEIVSKKILVEGKL